MKLNVVPGMAAVLIAAGGLLVSSLNAVPEKGGAWQVCWRVPLRTSRPMHLPRSVVSADLDGNGTHEIIVHGGEEEAIVFEAGGAAIRRIPIAADLNLFCVSQGAGGKQQLISFGSWSHRIEARNLNGQILWDYSVPDAIDWAAPVPARDADAGDNIAIGYNGTGGVRLLDNNGGLLWHASGPANVWSVAGAQFVKNSPAFVLCSHSGGTVLAFDHSGRQAAELKPKRDGKTPFVVGMVYGADLDRDGTDEALGLETTVNSGQSLWVFSADGTLRWRARALTDYAFIKGAVITGRFLHKERQAVALGVKDGTVLLYDYEGRSLPKIKMSPNLIGFCTLRRPNKPLDAIVALTAEEVICYEWMPSSE